MKVGDLHRELGEFLNDPDVFDEEVLVAVVSPEGVRFHTLATLQEGLLEDDGVRRMVLEFDDEEPRDSDKRVIVLWPES